MKTFIDKCCDKCWHNNQTQCELFIQCCTDGPLCHHDEKCKSQYEKLNRELKYIEHDQPVIFIGMGTCGLAAGAKKVEEAIKEELKKLNIEAKIEPTGCVGYCAKEVIVDIKLPGGERISYCEITPKLIPRLLQKTLIEKEIFEEKLLGIYSNNSGTRSINQVPFFKKQLRVVLKNCGMINPDSIDTYISFGGFKALDKVLRLLKPGEVDKRNN